MDDNLHLSSSITSSLYTSITHLRPPLCQLIDFKGIFNTSASGQDGATGTRYTLQNEITKLRQNI